MACAKIKARPYAWPHDGALRPSNAALLIIDMQALLLHTPSKAACLPTLAKMHDRSFDEAALMLPRHDRSATSVRQRAMSTSWAWT